MRSVRKDAGTNSKGKPPETHVSDFSRQLLKLPPEVLAHYIETNGRLTGMISEGFRGIAWYLYQMGRTLKNAREAHLYLLRGEDLVHAAGVEIVGKKYNPLYLDAEFSLAQHKDRALEVLPLVGIEDPPLWEMVYVLRTGKELRAYNTILGDLEFRSYHLWKSTETERFLAPLYVRERSGTTQLGVIEISGPNITFGNFEPRTPEQADALTDLTIHMIATLSRSIARVIQAKTDALTALPLRREGREKLIEAITAWKRGRIDDFTVFVADVDHFKKVNDTHGHPIGDLVLQEEARILSTGFRVKTRRDETTAKDRRKRPGGLVDFVYRDGGEEFAGGIIGGIDLARIALERVRKTLEETIVRTETGKEIVPKTTFGAISIQELVEQGVISVKDSIDHIIAVMKARADERLYLGKENGRNRVETGQTQ